VPVVASDAGGLGEVVRDGETGALCPVGAVEGMAAAGVRILGDADRWRAMSTAAAADARVRFGQDAVVSQYEALYQRAAAKRPRPMAAAAAAAVDRTPAPGVRLPESPAGAA
jgi:glycosyltransferase involved in cell wall biosynthesis